MRLAAGAAKVDHLVVRVAQPQVRGRGDGDASTRQGGLEIGDAIGDIDIPGEAPKYRALI